MLVLVVESGGTKTDWCVMDGNMVSRELQTIGFNPTMTTREEMQKTLTGQVLPWLENLVPEKIHFFGAGLGRPVGREEMKNLIRQTLNIEAPIQVDTDLLASAYACLGSDSGVVGIMGTGSVAFRYEKQKVALRRGGWGYLLGDEGGGIDLGKRLVRRLLERDFPDSVCQAYQQHSGLQPMQLLEQLYGCRVPALFLARQVPFLAEHRHEPVIRALLVRQIERFLKLDLLPLVLSPAEKVGLCGGVARIFSDLVEEICHANGLFNVFILKESPIRALVRYLFQPRVAS